MQALPGFRDYFPEECARRNYVTSVWRDVARRYGFVEYDAPILESLDLYAKKNSGGEILSQLFQFTDKGGREVALRPEMTPSLARMIAARERHYRKPMKWFCVAPFFRYEKQQKGRLREFWQFNADIVGETGVTADAELVAMAIDILRALGLGSEDVVVRLSNRHAWLDFLRQKTGSEEGATEFLAVIDKCEREAPEETEKKLAAYGCTLEEVRAFIASGGGEAFSSLLDSLEARGMRAFVEVDLTIVRGLAYYSGNVFEVFDRSRKMRALAGGGRYDNLLSQLSEGAVDLPAVGFGMGDVVLGNFIETNAQAKQRMEEEIARAGGIDLFIVVADASRGGHATMLLQRLRDEGWRVDMPAGEMKVGKQFQMAEMLGARYAIVIGSEWPTLKVKTLALRQEEAVSQEDLVGWLQRVWTDADPLNK